MIYPAFTAIAVSVVMIALICRGDPKRRRAAHLSGDGHGRPLRWVLVLTVLAPGLYLAARGDAAAFLIWLGSCAVAGWLVTLWAWRRQAE